MKEYSRGAAYRGTTPVYYTKNSSIQKYTERNVQQPHTHMIQPEMLCVCIKHHKSRNILDRARVSFNKKTNKQPNASLLQRDISVYLDGLYVAGLLLVSQELPLSTTEEEQQHIFKALTHHYMLYT